MTVSCKNMNVLSGEELLQIRIRKGMLCPGHIDDEQFWLLISISSMHSDKIIQALRDFLVTGLSRKGACERYDVNSGYFSTCLNRLQRISYISAQLSRYYNERTGDS
ncbi:adhesin biosynthesis transcription regulatory family protein [Enterobacter asburiae]|uniref:adhesin biosynthesis transcription regulatory family protein n=1 Tax=Enterobacter asburiae TaxID=61645 RepID=UPI003BBA0354